MAKFNIGDIVFTMDKRHKGEVGEIIHICNDLDCPTYYIDIGNNVLIYSVSERDIYKIPIDYIKKYHINLKDSMGYYKKFDVIVEELMNEIMKEGIKEEAMSPKILFTDGCGPSYLRGYYDITRSNDISIIANGRFSVSIIDVTVIVPNKVVEVTFADGSKTKSVCSESDVFSMDTAISICIAKKVMGGSSAYNNAVKHGMKVYQDKLAREVAEKEEQARIEKKRKKREEYKARRAKRRKEESAAREQAEKERQIEIQKEAYIRAMEYMENRRKEASEQED